VAEQENKEPIELRVVSKGRYGTTTIEDQFGRKLRNCTDLKIKLNKQGFWQADLTLIHFPLDMKIERDKYSCELKPLPRFRDAFTVHFIYLSVIKVRVENALRGLAYKTSFYRKYKR
jgi:hypothetical protein